MATKKKVKKHLNIKGFLFLFLFLYLIGMLFYTFFTMPVENIYIKGTTLIKDNEIIEKGGLKNYPSLFSVSEKKLANKLQALELVKEVSIEKKLNGKLVINIVEEIPLYLNRSTNKVVLSSGKEVENNNAKYAGIPTLENVTTSETQKRFTEAFSKIDVDIIKMINEIEYDPDISEGITIDADRFLLRMNDGNLVYVNILNMDRLNNYKTIYAALTAKGTLLLDSYGTGDVYGLFTPFETQDEPKGDDDNAGEN